MDQSHRDARRAAARAFLESLNSLEETLQEENTTSVQSTDSGGQTESLSAPSVQEPKVQGATPQSSSTSSPRSSLPKSEGLTAAQQKTVPQKVPNTKKSPGAISLSELEQAIADIDQFMKSQNPPKSD